MYAKTGKMYTKKYKKIIASILVMLLVMSSLIPAYGGNGMSAMAIKAEAAETDNTQSEEQHIKLYAVNQNISTYAPDFEIPKEYPTSFQIEVPGGGKADYLTLSGNSVQVTNDGLIIPWKHYYESRKDYGSNYDNYRYDYGVTEFLVHTETSELKITVELVNYGEVFVNNVMDDYIQENITSDMTTYKKISKISEFAYSYVDDWEIEEEDVTLMMILGKGSRHLEIIIKMAEKLGYKARRCSYSEIGSDSNYYDSVLIFNDSEYYIFTLSYGDDGYIKTIKELDNLNCVSNIRGPFAYRFTEIYPTTPSDTAESVKGISITGYYDGYYDKENSSIEIPNTIDGFPVISIGSVYGFPEVKKVILPDTLIKINDRAFEGSKYSEVILKDGITTIGYRSFAAMENLKEIKIPNTVNYIGSDAFYGCNSLKEVSLPSELTVIEEHTFSYCDKLRKIILPEKLTTVKNYAFSDCNLLEEVYLPNSLKTVESYAFAGSENLYAVRIPNSVETIGECAFGYYRDLDMYEYLPKTNFKIIANQGTEAAVYAKENNIEILPYDHEHNFVNKKYRAVSCIYYDDEMDICGLKIDACTGCGMTHTEELEIQHDCVTTVYKPTYFEKGYSEYRCKNCSYYSYSDYVDCLKLSTPSQLKVTYTSPDNIGLSWQTVKDANGYNVYYKSVEDEYYTVLDVTSNSTVIKYLDFDKTYSVYVTAYMLSKDKNYKVYSDKSEEVTAKTKVGYVTGLKIKNFDLHSIHLEWNKVEGATSYLVYSACRETGGEYRITREVTSPEYTDNNLPYGKSFKYAVVACYQYKSEKLKSSVYPTVEGKTGMSEVAGFRQSKATTKTVTLTWDKFNGANNYILYKMIDGKWKVIAKPTSTSYTDKNLITGATYKYAIKAQAVVNSKNMTSPTYPTLEVGTALPKVENFKVSKTSNNAIKLTWNKLAKAQGYVVYRLSGNSWKNIGTTKSTEFTDKKLNSATKYTYAVRGYYKVGSTNVKSETYPQIVGITNLDEVKNFAVNKYNANAIKLTWNKLKGADGYVVYRMVSGKWKNIGTTTNTNYLDKGLKSGTGYKYAVKAFKKIGGKNIYSYKYPTLITSTAPDAVNFTLTAGKGQVNIKWSAVTGATGYIIHYKTNANDPWIPVLMTMENNYIKNGLLSGKTYYFKVMACRKYNGVTYNASYTTKSVKVK